MADQTESGETIESVGEFIPTIEQGGEPNPPESGDTGEHTPDTELAEMAERQQQEEAERFREVEVRCIHCDARATVTRTQSGAGFIILAKSGVPGDASFGVSEAGLPVCPNDGSGMRPVEAKPIAEAMAEAAEKLPADKIANPEQQPLFEPPPFDLHAAFAEIIKQQERVTSRRAIWEERKAEAKEAKDNLDQASEFLEKLIARTADQEREALRAARRAAERLADPTIADVPTPEEHARELSEMQQAALEQRELAGAEPQQIIVDDPHDPSIKITSPVLALDSEDFARELGALIADGAPHQGLAFETEPLQASGRTIYDLVPELREAEASGRVVVHPSEDGRVIGVLVVRAREEQLEPASPRMAVIEILRKHGAETPVDLAAHIFEQGGSFSDGELLAAAGISPAMVPAVIVELQAAIMTAGKQAIAEAEQTISEVDTPELRSAEVAKATEKPKGRRKKAVI